VADGKVSIGVISAELGISVSRVRQLVEAGRLPAERTEGGHRRFDLAAVRAAYARLRMEKVDRADPIASWQQTYEREGLGEDAAWSQSGLTAVLVGPALAIAEYVTTEMVNNAVDHSNGSSVHLTWQEDASGTVTIEVVDDGDGVFRHLAQGLGLNGDVDALGELTKGKRTTDPARHTGEGVFFSSKAVDTFVLEANGCRLTFDNLRDDVAFGLSPVTTGTVVRMSLDPTTTLVLTELFARYTEDFEFTRSRPRIQLFELGVTFISRSEAKRLAIGLDQFTEVELDFTGVTDVGQGFVDELLRVWAAGHPGTRLIPVGMNSPVEFMVNRAVPRPER
jgi:excisionase family DNA binding protein